MYVTVVPILSTFPFATHAVKVNGPVTGVTLVALGQAFESVLKLGLLKFLTLTETTIVTVKFPFKLVNTLFPIKHPVDWAKRSKVIVDSNKTRKANLWNIDLILTQNYYRDEWNATFTLFKINNLHSKTLNNREQ